MANYAYETGTTDGTATVPTGRRVKRFSLLAAGSAATVVITPPVGSALPTITIPALQPFGEEFGSLSNDLDTSEIPGGSTIAFTNVSFWFVRYV